MGTTRRCVSSKSWELGTFKFYHVQIRGSQVLGRSPHLGVSRGGGIKADPKQRSSSCLYRTYTYHAEAILLRPGCKCLSSTSPETWRPMKFIAGTATGVLLKSTQ